LSPALTSAHAELFRPYGCGMATVTLTRHADVIAVLRDPSFVVPPVPPAKPGETGLAWLRAHVARFSTGETHARRRRLVLSTLARIDPGQQRRRAFELTRSATPAPLVPATVLAEAIGLSAAVADRVAAAARGYFPGTDTGAEADEAVGALVQILGGCFDEVSAATVGLLVQAQDATTGLVTRTLDARDRSIPGRASMPCFARLRNDPPVRLMRRECTVDRPGLPAGTLVPLDLVAANRDPLVFADLDRFDPYRLDGAGLLTFGAGHRSCPGRDPALAIAAGIVEATASAS
jgi:hypothetical protein